MTNEDVDKDEHPNDELSQETRNQNPNHEEQDSDMTQESER